MNPQHKVITLLFTLFGSDHKTWTGHTMHIPTGPDYYSLMWQSSRPGQRQAKRHRLAFLINADWSLIGAMLRTLPSFAPVDFATHPASCFSIAKPKTSPHYQYIQHFVLSCPSTFANLSDWPSSAYHTHTSKWLSPRFGHGTMNVFYYWIFCSMARNFQTLQRAMPSLIRFKRTKSEFDQNSISLTPPWFF